MLKSLLKFFIAGLAIIFAQSCDSESQPNPIASQWPYDISGNLNGTTLIVPISLTAARDAIPPEYTIHAAAWRHLLPDFPDDMYPMMAVGVHDHDLRFPALNLGQPDFSRTSLEFPFIDIFGDGYSSFRWASTMLITEGSPAIPGSEGFGVTVYPATFEPSCDAYASDPTDPNAKTFTASSSPSGAEPDNDDRSMAFRTWPTSAYTGQDDTTAAFPYTDQFLRNITNQPVFASSPRICDNYKRLYNTSLTADENEPVRVAGRVTTNLEPFRGGVEWPVAYGWRLSTAFLEPPMPSTCESLKGYSGTGPGDSG